MKADLRFSFHAALALVAAFSFVLTSSDVQAATSKRKNPSSKLYVADVEGTSDINTGDKIEDLTKKSVHSAEGSIVETKPNSNNALVLSNGTGVFFDPDTRLEMKKFMQEPFSPNRNDMEVEPSVSQTLAYLPRGTVGLCTSKLVAGSTMVYNTPQASIAIRGRKVVIQSTNDTTIVSLLEGDVTVRGDLRGGGESLRPGQQAIIQRSSSSQPPIITIQPIPKDQLIPLDDKVTMACMARKTVYFDVAERKNNSDNAPGNSVFTQEDPAAEEIVPVPVIPGTIEPVDTISASSISTQ